ncbi:MAG: zinc-dependent metalloprotease [Pseudomonadota bacterium]
MFRFVSTFLLLSLIGCVASPASSPQAAPPEAVGHSGFFDFVWDEHTGRILLHIDELESPFIYQTSLARGIGSNDIGADRGRLGDTKLVSFYRAGNKILLIEENLGYRANSSNRDEQSAVRQSFASSVIWGFTIEDSDDSRITVDATPFLLRDAMSLSAWLGSMELGQYKVDASRSAIYMPRTRAFPDNTEFEAILTLTGEPKGTLLASVVPDPRAVTVHTHHSFIRLPPPGYAPLPYDPRAGYLNPSYGGRFADYAVPINERIQSAFTRRHRLEKKQPEADWSEPVEPIVYYLDRGAPEPVRSALLDGARWWNEAFETAGYRNAFKVEMLPADADPMDVRYNVIQWVHRSTRGWSYGASVIDPRTGEILKGHVSLGSLRVRQDFLLAEGLLAPYAEESSSQAMEDFSLARIRQLSAHEVGHTIGLEHNFAASVDDRASVMDYPFPLIELDDDGEIDLSNAYDEGIGEWDKRAVLWGYQDFPDGIDDAAARAQILRDTLRSGLKYVADRDGRHVGSAHIDANLWDNGADPVVELNRLMTIRRIVIDRFSASNIAPDRPMATLEEVLVPMYLLHRFQLHAAGKVLGGGYYRYDLKGDDQPGFRPASPGAQREALAALLNTLTPSELVLPESLVTLISPRPPGFERDRESFDRKTRQLFDQFAPADAAIALTLEVLLEPTRGERLHAQDASEFGFGLRNVLDGLIAFGVESTRLPSREGEVQRRAQRAIINALARLLNGDTATPGVKAAAQEALERCRDYFNAAHSDDRLWHVHNRWMTNRIEAALEGESTTAPTVTPPPGSPIGATVEQR